MKIRLVSTSDRSGGAASACRRLHEGLLQIDCKSRLLVRWQESSIDATDCLQDEKPVFEKALTYVRSYLKRLPVILCKNKRCELFSLASGPCTELPRHCIDYDIVNLHWCVSTLDIPSFFNSLSKNVKIVITLHDMNYFTGGCHYSNECTRYESNCGHCHWLRSPADNDLSRRNFLVKKTIFESFNKHRMCVVSPSNWLTKCAKQSSLLRRFRIETIPNSVDTKVFSPRAKSDFRSKYQIAQTDRMILFTADSLSNRRKGIDLLLDALGSLSTDDIVLVALGNGDVFAKELKPSLRLICPGFIPIDSELAEAYSTANLFVVSSRQDNLPNTVLEALACGTPVVGFDIGGVPDMVRDGETGFLARSNDSSDLARAIDDYFKLTNEQRQQMSTNCRRVAISEYSLKTQASAYKELFEHLLDDAS